MSTEWCDVYSRTVSRFSGKEVLWVYSFHKSQANITRAERIMFYTDSQSKAFKNTLIFRPVLEHQWAHNQAVTHQRKCFSPLVHRRSQRSFLITGDWATPYPNRWYGDYRHTKRKRNWHPYQLNAIQIWGDSFQIPPRKLYVTYILYKAHSFWREFGMNTSKVFTLLIKYTFAPSIWQKSTLSQTFYLIV